MWDTKKLLFETFVTPVILYGCEVWGCNISRESWKMIEHIHKRFITYKLKIKINTPYPILLIEVGLSPIESLAMTRLLLYKQKINNMGDHRLPKLAFNSIQKHLRIKRGWYKDTRAWLNYWERRNKDLEDKRGLRYYKGVINPTLKDQKYLSVLTSSKKKINISKIRTNSHELHIKIGRWKITKTSWVKRMSISMRIWTLRMKNTSS